jgi:hypothetical protein
MNNYCPRCQRNSKVSGVCIKCGHGARFRRRQQSVRAPKKPIARPARLPYRDD